MMHYQQNAHDHHNNSYRHDQMLNYHGMERGLSMKIIMTLILVFAGLFIGLGLMLSNAEFMQPRTTAAKLSISNQQWLFEAQRLQDQQAFLRQQQQQALVRNQLFTVATAQAIETGGITLGYGLALSSVILAIGAAWGMINSNRAVPKRQTSLSDAGPRQLPQNQPMPHTRTVTLTNNFLSNATSQSRRPRIHEFVPRQADYAAKPEQRSSSK